MGVKKKIIAEEGEQRRQGGGKDEIEEAGFNRWVNNDKHLPDWFVKDEKAHWRNRTPVQITKDMVEEYKKRQLEINARPIKKVAEAKARKRKSRWKSAKCTRRL